MTILENLRSRKKQLEQHLREGLGEEQRELIEGELMKIEIALSFLDDAGRPQADRNARKPPLG